MAYDSINSGYGTRFLTNLTCFWDPYSIYASHIGLGYVMKYGINSLEYFLHIALNEKKLELLP